MPLIERHYSEVCIESEEGVSGAHILMSVCASLRQAASPSGSASDDSGTYDSGTVSSIDSLLGPERIDPDFRIRQRLEASRQGMIQLDLLRSKHQKLMQV